MADVFIRSAEISRMNRAIINASAQIMNQALNRTADEILFKEAEKLADKVENSNEFRDVQTTLVGEFGFTAQEVAQLPRIFSLLIPGTDRRITRIDRKTGTLDNFAILRWNDLETLFKHPFAQHDLTRFNVDTRSFQLTETVSWIQWWEEGQVRTGVVFDPNSPNARRIPPSRSGKGLMRETTGGIWRLEPTFIFRKTADAFNPKNMVKQFKLLVKKVRR